MSEENTGGFLQPIQNREGVEFDKTTIHSGYLIWMGKEQAAFKVSELFTKREVDEMQRKINTIDDFMYCMNEFYKRSEIPNFVPFDITSNKNMFEPPPKFLYSELSAKYNNLPADERDAKVFEEMKKIAPVPKNGTYLCNVSKVSLQMEVYWKEATQEQSAGFYMRPMQGQEIKWNNHSIENVCQLTV